MKLREAEVAAIQRLIPHREFVAAWKRLESDAKELSKKLLSKEAALNSGAWKILASAKPEALLYLDVTGRNKTVDEKIKNFFGKWRQVQEKIPITQMAELRITPQLPEYATDLPGGVSAAAGRQTAFGERDREISCSLRAAAASPTADAGAPWTGCRQEGRTTGCQGGTAGDCAGSRGCRYRSGKRSCREFQGGREQASAPVQAPAAEKKTAKAPEVSAKPIAAKKTAASSKPAAAKAVKAPAKLPSKGKAAAKPAPRKAAKPAGSAGKSGKAVAKSVAGKNAKHGAGKKSAAKAPAKKQHGHKIEKNGKGHAKRR